MKTFLMASALAVLAALTGCTSLVKQKKFAGNVTDRPFEHPEKVSAARDWEPYRITTAVCEVVSDDGLTVADARGATTKIEVPRGVKLAKGSKIVVEARARLYDRSSDTVAVVDHTILPAYVDEKVSGDTPLGVLPITPKERMEDQGIHNKQ